MSERDVQVQNRRLSRASLENQVNKQRRSSDLSQKSPSESNAPPRASFVQHFQLDSLPEQVRRDSRLLSDARRVSQYAYAGAPQRRASQWMRRPSVAGSLRMTTTTDTFGVPRVLYENTYRIEPTKKQRFVAGLVETTVTEILQSYLDGEQYDARKCSDMSKHLSDVIKARVKDLGLCRHKLVCVVTIGQAGGQAIRCVSRCLWDQTNDGHATATYQNSSLFATAIIFAVYYE